MTALEKEVLPLAKSRVERSHDEHFGNLSEEQWMSVYYYGKYGYSLKFVRVVDESPLAVIQRDTEMITINNAGDIGDMTGITLRA
tara:strand:+ start:962 stop:1216 length:255 start_codon:yes stop_codon:yes gene_type:complete